MPITALYASLLVPLFIFLAFQIISLRHAKKIGIGDGGDIGLRRCVRAHGNFAEYAPYAIILMGLAESLGAYPALLHPIGVALVGSRALHAYGVSQIREPLRLRVATMSATFLIFSLLALTCFFLSAKSCFGL